MAGAIERRQMVLEYLSDNRKATYRELAEHFGVSKNTIVTDIAELTIFAPIETVSGNRGGIRVADGWYVHNRYLREEQERALENILNGIEPDVKVIESILIAFRKPKVKG
ncbi:MAG: HTH domain-containing protein [Clostridia bacterium]|nr:HTH domain-containing protein [Clostridia bacterium]